MSIDLSKLWSWLGRFLVVAGAVAVLVGALVFCQKNSLANAPICTLVVFLVGAGLIAAISGVWLSRIDSHPLLRSDEKLQNKDALVIATTSLLALHLGLCVVAAGASQLFLTNAIPAAFLALTTSLAALAVGGAFGFLLGHPRRLTGEDNAKNGRTGSTWLLNTGLDDIVDWLVKGLTTVLLVEFKQVLTELQPLAKSLGNAFAGPTPDAVASSQGYAFALAMIVYFTIFGAGTTCLVTRTYLTGALGRADRSTVNAFSRVGLDWGEILLLVGAQRSLGSRTGTLSSEIQSVATKLAALSLNDLRTPQEYALWAKAKSALGQSAEAITGYDKAILQCDCNPALLLDYAVALSDTDKKADVLSRLEQARLQISEATPEEIRKNIYKSLTFALLYLPHRYDRVIALADEYFNKPGALPSGGLRVNEVCAYGQRFREDAMTHGLLREQTDGSLRIEPADSTSWPESMRIAYDRALEGIRATLTRDPDWKNRFLQLLVHGDKTKHPDDTDLEAFEAFKDFRLLLGLPPLPSESNDDDPPSQTTRENTTAGSGSETSESTTEIATDNQASADANPLHVQTTEPPSQSVVDPKTSSGPPETDAAK